MSRLLSARRLASLGLLLAACAAPALMPAPAARPAPRVTACLLVSPNTRDDLDLSAARARLRSPEHNRYRALAGDILAGLEFRGHRVHDALGEWEGLAENSLFVSLHDRADPVKLACAAAWFGLAAQQKAVLAFHADPAGDCVLAIIDLPGRSLAEVRSLLDGHGFRDRTLMARGNGWRAVVVTDRERRAGLKRLPASVRLEVGRAVVIGESTRARAQQRYREVIRSYHKTSAVPPLAKLDW